MMKDMSRYHQRVRVLREQLHTGVLDLVDLARRNNLSARPVYEGGYPAIEVGCRADCSGWTKPEGVLDDMIADETTALVVMRNSICYPCLCEEMNAAGV